MAIKHSQDLRILAGALASLADEDWAEFFEELSCLFEEDEMPDELECMGEDVIRLRGVDLGEEALYEGVPGKRTAVGWEEIVARIEQLAYENGWEGRAPEYKSPAHPEKPVVWARRGDLPSLENHFWTCSPDGTRDVTSSGYVHGCSLEEIAIKWKKAFGFEVEVREWKEDTVVLKPTTWTVEIFRKYLTSLRAAVRSKKMTGADASIAKWDACIEYAEQFREIPPRDTRLIPGGWNEMCGLCEEYFDKEAWYSGICPLGSDKVCPVDGTYGNCTRHSDWLGMRNAEDVVEWLDYAKSFRSWIIKECGRTTK